MNGVELTRRLLIWSRHREVLPRFSSFLEQRARRAAERIFACPRCAWRFDGVTDWRARTELVERYSLTPGGFVYERRRCRCGALHSAPAPTKGEDHAPGRNS